MKRFVFCSIASATLLVSCGSASVEKNKSASVSPGSENSTAATESNVASVVSQPEAKRAGEEAIQAPPQAAAAGNEYLGTWVQRRMSTVTGRDARSELTITRDGSIYVVTLRQFGNPGAMGGTFPATYANGVLKTNTILGDVAYLPSQESVLFGGERFAREQ